MTKHNYTIDVPSKRMIQDISMEKEHLVTPALQRKIQELMNFFDSSGIDYDKFDSESNKINLNERLDTKAYPNNEDYMYIPGQRDVQKWMQTIKEIYDKEQNGMSRIPAIKQATHNWDVMETFDFLNWLRYYEGGNHLKYKSAQLWYENSTPGYFLPIKKDSPIIDTNKEDVLDAKVESTEMSPTEKKRIIEKQRNKIIGRLDSAEKLIRSEDGQIFSGNEYEILLDAIYQLKKKIHTVNKVSTSTRLYEDLIVQHSNLLNSKGFVKSASFIYSLAQANNPPTDNSGKKETLNNIPETTPPAAPTTVSGQPGGLPSTGPGMAQNPPDSAPNEMSPNPEKSIGISKFLENLETGNTSSSEDVLEVSDEDSLIVEAQEIPIDPPDLTPRLDPKKRLPGIQDNLIQRSPATENPLEVIEDDFGVDPPMDDEKAKNFDNMIDAAFTNLKVDDVVAKLEDLAKIFKTREIPRQLAIVDMMLDSLGLASYFPALAEATSKSLESNNYISTRVEDVLGMLRGAMEGNEIDLKGNDEEQNEEVAKIQKVLKENEHKEKEKKMIKRNLEKEEKELDKKMRETPNVDISEDLSAPIKTSPVIPKAPTPIKQAPIPVV